MTDTGTRLQGTREVTKGGAAARIMWIVTVFTAATVGVFYVRLNQIGPRWFWSTDACADPAMACGTWPLVMLPAAVGMIVLTVLGIAIIRLLELHFGDTVGGSHG